MGTRGDPVAALHWAVGANKTVQSSISKLLDPMFFLLPGAAGTRGTTGAVLHREAGAGAHGTRAGFDATFSRCHAAAPELICARRRVLPSELP
jgi:hypothetical protein